MGGGQSSSATATSGSNLGSDTFNYGTITPAAPPLTAAQSYLMPAIIGGAILFAALLLKQK